MKKVSLEKKEIKNGMLDFSKIGKEIRQLHKDCLINKMRLTGVIKIYK